MKVMDKAKAAASRLFDRLLMLLFWLAVVAFIVFLFWLDKIRFTF